jgi:uncharacterized protein involved in oxidation of intracellular sulfur
VRAEDVKTLLILNDAPYGTERSYNGFRLAMSLAKREGEQVRVFLMGDAVACARSGQKTADGYYNVERMVRAVAQRGGEVGCCGSCSDARALTDETRVQGAHRSSMDELTDWTLWADRVITF